MPCLARLLPHAIAIAAVVSLAAPLAVEPAQAQPAGVAPVQPEILRTLSPKRQRIVDYFEKLRGRYEIVATTRTPSGQVIDWIKPESQVAGGRLSVPPPFSGQDALRPNPASKQNPDLFKDMPAELRKQIRAERGARTELQTSPRAIGPVGTVPIVRFDVRAYLDAVRDDGQLPDDPKDLISKVPPPDPASNDRYYAVWHRYGDVFGTTGRINIWNVAGPVSNETSIGQVAVIRGTPMQAIEAGKIETQGFSPSRRPVFFTYYRTSGSASGDWVGGYNTLVAGWVQVSRSVAPGMSLVPWESRTGGNQYSLDVQVRLWQGNWWVWAAGEWAGYYPYCKGGGAQPCTEGTLFSTAGIRDKADRLDWYGEVFDSSAPAATTTDMGSGAFANQGWGRAAYFRNLTYFWAPNTHWWWEEGSINTTDAACYSAQGPHYSSDPNYRNWFYYGGPGDEAAGCD